MVNRFYQIELLCKEEKIMEKHYGVESFSENESYFTDSQSQDVLDFINEGLTNIDIIEQIKMW
jgi:hypothetical protein